MKRPFVLIVFSVFFGGIYGSYECFYEFTKFFDFSPRILDSADGLLRTVLNSRPLDNFGSSDLKVKLSETV